MLSRHLTLARVWLLAIDAAAAVVLFVLISIVRFGDIWQDAWAVAGAPWWVFAAAYGALWAVAEWLQGLDRLRSRWRAWSEILDVGRATALVAVIVFSLLFLVQAPEVSRKLLLALFAAQMAVTIGQRLLLRAILARREARGIGTRRVLILGTGPSASAFVAVIERHRELGFAFIGHLGPPADLARPVLGPFDSLELVLNEHVVDEVVACLEPEDLALLEPVASLCLEVGKLLRVPLPLPLALSHAARVETLDGIEIATIGNSPDRVLGLVLKRVMDVVLSAVALALLIPLFAVVGVVTLAFDGRPVLFRQTRVGLHGRPFTMLKFRSMVPDAEARLDEIAALNEIQGHAFKIESDPRVTRLGAFLRKTSIDELPQLLNVLRGEMSIVGPRPPLPDEVAKYDLWHRRRLSMKPGITGLWQVSARREEEFDRWVELDLAYIDRWSIWLDIRIMVRTVPAMLHGR
jgi:exopolysaccharide biosynthesis polyprenyl glycosylphosphotransferase